MRHADPDDALLRDLLGPPPIGDAREAVRYWRTRLSRLPRRRVRARREARAMLARWERRALEARLSLVPAEYRDRALDLWFGGRRLARRAGVGAVVAAAAVVAGVWALVALAALAILS
jgi:hypothetical protein